MFVKTEEQELMLESLSELLDQYGETYYKRIDEEGRPPFELGRAMVDNGFALMGVPEEFGGTPADTTTLCLMQEEIGKHGGPFSILNYALTICDVLEFGNDEQKRMVIQAVNELGVCPCSLGITEPQAGSDDNAIASTYVRKDGKIILNGHKTFMSGGEISPYCLFIAKNPEATDPSKAFTCFMFSKDLPGITQSKMEKIGVHYHPTYEAYFDNVEVDESNIMGKEGEGFLFAMKNFEPERLLIAAGCLGWAEAAFEDAARYANQRVQFGKPIGSFQLIQQKITEMYIKIENMRSLIYNSAREIDEGMSGRVNTAMCKYYVPKAAQEVIDDAMQILGGIGYTCDHRVSRMWRDIRVQRIGGGTDEIMVHILGRQLLKQFK